MFDNLKEKIEEEVIRLRDELGFNDSNGYEPDQVRHAAEMGVIDRIRRENTEKYLMWKVVGPDGKLRHPMLLGALSGLPMDLEFRTEEEAVARKNAAGAQNERWILTQVTVKPIKEVGPTDPQG